MIKSGDHEFFTQDKSGNQAKVNPGVSSTGRKFLTTSRDGITDNNLDEITDNNLDEITDNNLDEITDCGCSS